jgi:hypothetical protein
MAEVRVRPPANGEMMLRYMGRTEAADAIITPTDKAITSRQVIYDSVRKMEGATEVKCSGFAHVTTANLCRAESAERKQGPAMRALLHRDHGDFRS